MTSRYALYIRRKDTDVCFSFSASYADQFAAQEKVEWINRSLDNMEAILIESIGPGIKVDPYHIHFAQKETVGA